MLLSGAVCTLGDCPLTRREVGTTFPSLTTFSRGSHVRGDKPSTVLASSDPPIVHGNVSLVVRGSSPIVGISSTVVIDAIADDHRAGMGDAVVITRRVDGVTVRLPQILSSALHGAHRTVSITVRIMEDAVLSVSGLKALFRVGRVS